MRGARLVGKVSATLSYDDVGIRRFAAWVVVPRFLIPSYRKTIARNLAFEAAREEHPEVKWWIEEWVTITDNGHILVEFSEKKLKAIR